MVEQIQFKSESDLSLWLARPQNLTRLKERFSPINHRAILNLTYRKITILNR